MKDIEAQSGQIRRLSNALVKTLPFSLIGLLLIFRGASEFARHQNVSGAIELSAGIGIGAIFVVLRVTRNYWRVDDVGVHPVPTLRETFLTALVVLLIVAVMVLMSIDGIVRYDNNLLNNYPEILAAMFGLLVAAFLLTFAIYIVIRTSTLRFRSRRSNRRNCE